MRVIGTAGHVDHGKSTLVEALTGMHPDRLKEEREREMTIDLGFAWLTLPDGEEIGIVDVPGHRDFIENMLAGIGGIDAALFVIAADEGVMPQTREHLAILDLLNVHGGVVALTKVDLIVDQEWLDMVEEDIRQEFAGTVLSSAPILRVSARSGVGIQSLVEAISDCLAGSPPRLDLGRPRLPVDRVFTIAGFGTVVTGTLIDGRFQLGDEVEILPGKVKGRIRGLQTHKKKENYSIAGSRTAVNISGINVDQVSRGDVVAHPGDYQPSVQLDVRFRLLPDANRSLKHNTEVKLFIGAAEVLARIRLLGEEELYPGQEGWLQLELNQPVVAIRGDHYILRLPSPGETIGGGIVVDPYPRGRHKRFSAQTIARLESLERGTPEEVLFQALSSAGIVSLNEVILASQLDSQVALQATKALAAEGLLVDLDQDPVIEMGESRGKTAEFLPQLHEMVASKAYLEQLSSRAVGEVENYHHAYPLRTGMPREELKSRLKVPTRIFNVFLRRIADENLLQEAGPLVRIPGHQITFSPQQEDSVLDLIKRFSASPFATPSVKECQSEVGEEVYNALIESGQLIQVSSEVVFSRDGYKQMLKEIMELFEKSETISAAQARDYFNTSRRYVLAFLEYLDQIGVTYREGDVRRLRK